MHIKLVDIHNCRARAHDFAHQYSLQFIGSDDPEKSVDRLIDIYTSYLARPRPQILELDIDFKESAVYSGVFIKDGHHVDICIAKNLNLCWKRFAIAKEVFHSVLDEEEFRNMNINEHLQSVLNDFPSEDAKPNRSVASEWLTEMATMEFLFPYEKRKSELSASAHGQLNYRNIAQKYRIPQVKVERYLSAEYMENLGKTI